MTSLTQRLILSCAVFFTAMLLCHGAGAAERKKVLVVMSYHESYPWGREIKEGVDSVLAETSEVRYCYLDTKNNPQNGPGNAEACYDVYLEFRPDGVIAADDAAQSLFVVPYLRGKVATPVMFCGVNKEPEEYGYPAANVSGIVERVHVKESLAFLQQLVPSVRNFCALMKVDPSSQGILLQILQEKNSYPAHFVRSEAPHDLAEAIRYAKQFSTTCDALFLTPMDGLSGDQGKSLTTKEVTPALVKAFGKPTISENDFNLRSGVLCAVIKTGQEQGGTAARMLQQAMAGAPLSVLPITRNHFGKRMINISEMKKLGIRPKPVYLVGVEMVETEE